MKSTSPGSFPPMRVPRARRTRVENILALAHYFKSPLFMREKQAIQFLSFVIPHEQRSAFCMNESL